MMCRPHLETKWCGRHHSWEVRWDCAAPRAQAVGHSSVLTAELQKRSWDEAETPGLPVILDLPGGTGRKIKFIYWGFKLETGMNPICIEKTHKIHAKYKLSYKKLQARAPLTCSILDLRDSASTSVVEVFLWFLPEYWSYPSVTPGREKSFIPSHSCKSRWIQDFPVRPGRAFLKTSRNLWAKLRAKSVLYLFQ